MNIKIDQIVTGLLAIPSLSAIFGTRIYYGEPVGDNQAGIYLILNVLSQRSTRVDKQARVEFRICAHNESVTKKALMDACDTINAEIVTYNNTIRLTYGTFTVYHVTEGTTLRVLRDEKNQNVLIHDYLFSFTY